MSKSPSSSSNGFFKKLYSRLNLDHLLLLILTAVHGINNYIWLTKDNMIQRYDAAQYILYSYQYHELFTNPTTSLIIDFFAINRWRPPLRLMIATPFYQMFGYSADIASMTNIFYMVILLFSVYGIGSYLFSRRVGLLAAIMVSLFPIVHILSRVFLSDFALTAMVSLSIYCLLRTEYFTNRRFSLLFGISIGLGFLTKDTYFIFMLGPLIYVMYKSRIFNIPLLFKTLVRNWQALLIVIISAASIGGFFYYLFGTVMFPDDTRFTAKILVLFFILSSFALLTVWFLWATNMNVVIDRSLESIMLRTAVSFLPFLLLGMIFVLPDITTVTAIALFTAALLGFAIVNMLLLKNDYAEWRRNGKKEEFRKHPWLNFNKALIVGLVVCGWFYIPMSHRIFPNLFLNPTYIKPEEGHVDRATWESISYYFMGLPNQQLYLYFFVLIVCLVLVFIHYRRPTIAKMRSVRFISWPKVLVRHDWKAKLSLVLWVVIPYVLFSISHTKNSRFVAPYLPALAIGMAAVLLSFPKRWQRITAVMVVLSIGGLQLITHSYGISELPEKVSVDTPLGEILIFGQETLGRRQYNVHPNPDDWHVDDALNYIYADLKEQARLNGSVEPGRVIVGAVTDGFVNAYVLLYTAMEEKLPVTLRSIQLDRDELWGNESAHVFFTDFDSIDYMIELENFTIRPHLAGAQKYFHDPEHFNQFGRLSEYQLPDDSTLVVYRRI